MMLRTTWSLLSGRFHSLQFWVRSISIAFYIKVPNIRIFWHILIWHCWAGWGCPNWQGRSQRGGRGAQAPLPPQELHWQLMKFPYDMILYSSQMIEFSSPKCHIMLAQPPKTSAWLRPWMETHTTTSPTIQSVLIQISISTKHATLTTESVRLLVEGAPGTHPSAGTSAGKVDLL